MTNASSHRRPPATPSSGIARLGRVVTIALGLAACADPGSKGPTPDGETGGAVVIAIAADPGTLMPPLAGTTAALTISSLVFEHLAEIGDSLNSINDAGFQPRLAERWTWAADSMSIAFHLNPRARWHDGRAVRSEDVRFTFDVYNDAAVGSPFTPLL